MSSNNEYSLFLEQSARYMEMNIPRIENCLGRISEEEVWWSPNNNTNSIANLILHLSGNVRQYIVSGLGGNEDIRIRDEEFSASESLSKPELLERITFTIRSATAIINSLDKSAALSSYELQGFSMTGIEAIIHVTEHLSYHTGQIALITKIIRDEDLGFYSGKDLNAKNK